MSVIENIKKRFPDIENVEIRAVISMAGIDNIKRSWQAKNEDIPDIIPCGNSKCNLGGFDAFSMIWDAIKNNKTKGSENCLGEESIARINTRSCAQTIDYEIIIKKKD